MKTFSERYKHAHEQLITKLLEEYIAELKKLTGVTGVKLIDVPGTNLRQRALLKQQRLIEAGYQAVAKFKANGEHRLIISINGGPTLKELVIR